MYHILITQLQNDKTNLELIENKTAHVMFSLTFQGWR